MRDRHQGVAGRDGVDAGRGARRRGMRRGRRARNVAWNDQALARPHIGGAAHLVDLHDRARRYAVFMRDLIERLALADGHRRAAVPGPMSGRRRGRMVRRHRAGDVVTRSRPVGDQRLGAIGHAAIDRHGAGPRRCRQRLCHHAVGGRRVDRAGHVALWAGIGRVRAGVEARAIRATGCEQANRRQNCKAGPKTRATRRVGVRHMVTHWYATNVECEIKQRPVNKLLRISGLLPHLLPTT